MKSFAPMLAMAFAMFPFFASAQGGETFDQAGERCRALSDKADREACITKFATTNWIVTRQIDKLDGSKTIAMMIFSPDEVPTNRTLRHPSLSIRCLKNRTELHIGWPDFLGLQAVSVKWRLDDQPVVTERWNASGSGDGAFTNNPVDLSKKMLGKKEFVISVAPYNKVASTVTFNLAGLEEAIKPLREVCKW